MATKVFSGDQGLSTEWTSSSFDIYDMSALVGGDAFHVYLKPNRTVSLQDYPFYVTGSPSGKCEVFGKLTATQHGQFVSNMGTSDAHGEKTGEIARKEFYGPDAIYNCDDPNTLSTCESFNSVCVFIKGPVCHIHDLTIASPLNFNRSVDAFRIRSNAHGSVVERTILWAWGDDALESDNNVYDIILRDNLWMNGFVGWSASHSVGSKKITIERSILHLTNRFQDAPGEYEHSHVWKCHSPGPYWVMNNCVVAVETPNYKGYNLSNGNHTKAALNRMSGTGNTFCFIDSQMPNDHPAFPAGWTVLEGATARNFYESERDKKLAELTGTSTTSPTAPYSVLGVSQSSSTGVMSIDTNRAFAANPKLTLHAENEAGFDTATIGVTIG